MAPTPAPPAAAAASRDASYLALFALHTGLVATLVWMPHARGEAVGGLSPDSVTRVVAALQTCAVLAAVGGLLWARAVYQFSTSRRASRLSLPVIGASVALLGVASVVLLASGHFVLGAMVTAAAVCEVALARLEREQQAFMTELLGFVGDMQAADAAALAGASVRAQVLALAYTLYWAASLGRALSSSPALAAPLVLLLLLSLRWSLGLGKGALFYAAGGSVTGWLLRAAAAAPVGEPAGSEEAPAAAPSSEGTGGGDSGGGGGVGGGADAANALERLRPAPLLRDAVGRGAGTIMVGSLVGFLAPLAWPASHAGRHIAATATSRWLAAAGHALYGAARSYLRAAHKYSFVGAARDGRQWHVAARQGWAALHRAGVEAVLDDDVVDRLLVTCCGIAAASAALLTGVALGTPPPPGAGAPLPTTVWVLCAGAAGYFGFSAVATPLAVVEGAVAAVMVAFAETPEALAAAHPAVTHRFSRLAEEHELRVRARRAGVAEDEEHMGMRRNAPAWRGGSRRGGGGGGGVVGSGGTPSRPMRPPGNEGGVSGAGAVGVAVAGAERVVVEDNSDEEWEI